MRHGGQILIDQLAVHGCKMVFCVPGESFLPALDGLYDQADIGTIVCRNEGGAVMMAEAYGKLTNEPGIGLVTRGPGATNASAGIHVAQQDSTPVILFVGLPQQSFTDREAFQEIDLKSFFGSMAKWVGVIPDAQRIPEYISRAFHIAKSGRPGPVIIGLPEDVLHERIAVDDAKCALVRQARISASELDLLESALARSTRPLMVVGGPGWSKTAQADVEMFSSKFQIPVATAFRCQGHFDNRHDNYCGHFGIGADPALVNIMKDCDLLFVLGARLDEKTTGGFSYPDLPDPAQFFIHAHVTSDQIGRIYRADLPIISSSASLAQSLNTLKPADNIDRSDWCRSAHANYLDHILPVTTPGNVKFEQVVKAASEILDEDAIITSGAGNYTAWLHRYFQYKGFGTQLAPISGSMGYGLPAAIAAKLTYPNRQVVAFAGDGCLMMSVQELATALQYGLDIIVILINNGQLGTIRMHQELHFPGRVMGTFLSNPDFQLLAKSFGAQVELVEESLDFRPALGRAIEHVGLSLIELRTDPNALSPAKRG